MYAIRSKTFFCSLSTRMIQLVSPVGCLRESAEIVVRPVMHSVECRMHNAKCSCPPWYQSISSSTWEYSKLLQACLPQALQLPKSPGFQISSSEASSVRTLILLQSVRVRCPNRTLNQLQFKRRSPQATISSNGDLSNRRFAHRTLTQVWRSWSGGTWSWPFSRSNTHKSPGHHHYSPNRFASLFLILLNLTRSQATHHRAVCLRCARQPYRCGVIAICEINVIDADIISVYRIDRHPRLRRAGRRGQTGISIDQQRYQKIANGSDSLEQNRVLVCRFAAFHWYALVCLHMLVVVCDTQCAAPALAGYVRERERERTNMYQHRCAPQSTVNK